LLRKPRASLVRGRGRHTACLRRFLRARAPSGLALIALSGRLFLPALLRQQCRDAIDQGRQARVVALKARYRLTLAFGLLRELIPCSLALLLLQLQQLPASLHLAR
jgi:hypothetical protein